MPKKSEYWGVLCAAAFALPFAAHAADTLTDAITGGKASGNFRLRYEDVGVDSQAIKDATALTLRSRLGYETAPFHGFTAILEFEDTHTVNGEDEYAPETAGYAPVVDPKVTEINRAYLRYRGVPKLDLGLGRQRIILDNQRFLGSVGWRQDEQTFDAFTAKYDGIADWSFYYAYIDQVNGIADIKPNLNFDIASSDNLFNASYNGFSLGKITAYAYLLDNEERDTVLRNVAPDVGAINPALRFKSNDTYGVRFDGGYALSTVMPVKLLYTLEYADQSLENPAGVDFDTDYSLYELGISFAPKVAGLGGPIVAKISQETLSSDDGLQGFQTPYATKHAFNGWVDMFLNTPTTGLVDQYVTLSTSLYGIGLTAMYHEYSPDDGSGDFGSEWNVQALKKFTPNFTMGVKYGSYSADDAVAGNFGAAANIDTDKLWVWGEFNF